ncbi:MAG: alpha/beta fold hydrolase, partial [Rhodospirillaceae bacterium]|nr:alpha/beta fold hydrolase [Rhodospirillaceae bacterium]
MSKTITTDDGTTLHVVESGLAQGLVLMFCNSLGTDHRMWDGQARRFGGDYRIVRYDRRGHGGSSAPPGPYSFERLGRDALCVLDALEIDKTWFCGLSMGGMTGMWLAANAGERFHGLVLANTGAHMPPREMWAERIDMARAGNLALMVETVLGRWFTA